MRKLTKIVAPALIAAMGIGAAAVPAQAASHARQDSRHDGQHGTPARNSNIRAEINSLSRDIDRAAARRVISNREAASLKRDTAEIQRLYATYARNGLTSRETSTLQNRVGRIQAALRGNDRRGRR